MDKKRENKMSGVFDEQPRRCATSADGCTDESDVRTVLLQMCSCMSNKKKPRHSDGLYNVLYSWYVPRNENDAAMYMVRFRMLRVLAEYVDELLNKLIWKTT